MPVIKNRCVKKLHNQRILFTVKKKETEVDEIPVTVLVAFQLTTSNTQVEFSFASNECLGQQKYATGNIRHHPIQSFDESLSVEGTTGLHLVMSRGTIDEPIDL